MGAQVVPIVVVVVLVILAVLFVCAALWVRRAVSVSGTLKPRVAPGVGRRGWMLSVDLAETHYAIFSQGDDATLTSEDVMNGLGTWGRGTLDKRHLVVFLHGLAAQLDQLTWGSDGGFAKSLVDAGYCVLGIDLYGHGFSEGPDADLGPADFQRQLDAVLSRLGVAEPFDLVGFSHGCFVATDFASNRPAMVKRLVLMSPFGCNIFGQSSWFVAGLVTAIVHLTFDGNASHMRTIYRIVKHLEGQRWPSMLQSINTSNVRVLVVAGAWDCDPVMRILQHAHRIHQALPQSTLHIVPRGTHMSWAMGSPNQQNLIRRRVLEFLSIDLARPGPEVGTPSGEADTPSEANGAAASQPMLRLSSLEMET